MELSTLGLGTYLGEASDQADSSYREAIGAFHSLGGTVFDTAANYRDGRSERVLGAALRDLPREDFFLSTKAGYIPMPQADPNEGPEPGSTGYWKHRAFWR